MARSRTAIKACAATVGVLSLALVAARPAHADSLGRYRGRLVVSATAFGSFSTDGELLELLHKLGTTTLKKESGDTEGWPFHFIAFLTRKAGDATVHLVFYDRTGGKRAYVNVYDFTVQPDATSVSGDVTLTDSDGFKVGHKYEVDITRIIDGREHIFSHADITLE